MTIRSDVVALLRCPHCAADLHPVDRVVRCPAGHAFDVARQGYVNLLPGNARAGTADTSAMVAARDAFLAAGHYDPLVEAVADTALEVVAVGRPGGLLEVGAGTGRFLAAVLQRLDDRVGLALDLSKHATRRAARAHPRMGAAVCDVWKPLPVRSGAAALALNVFAPRNGAELARVLRPDGALVVVTPTAEHLREVVTPLGLLSVDPDKEQRLAGALGDRFTATSRRIIETSMKLAHDDVRHLAAMGPSAWHADTDVLEAAIEHLPASVQVTASVAISVHRPRARSGAV